MVPTASPQQIITTFSLAFFLEIVANSLMLPVQARSIHAVPMSPLFPVQSVDFPLATTIVQADNQQTPRSQLSQTEWNNFTPPSRGTPGRREGAGTRGRCPGGVTALIPTSTLGRTALEKPTIYYYIPTSLETVLVKFELLDEEDDTLYEKTLEMKETKAGVIGLDLSQYEDAPTLEVNKNYHWYLTIRCEPDTFDPSGDIVINGWINRVALSPNQLQALESEQPSERLNLYAEEALWYETVSTLAQLRLSNPEDTVIQQRWAELLNSVGLGDIAPQPLISSELIQSTLEQ
ncbi:hypothetical protein M595_1466 [Lyngbya aestuarii BL J]|uniref:DUF928 domain-containing protein n=1 Tax=Lyngbya aestuarii BL J TaxID=1348334 RepID=U7QQ46_9CYAN|nr:DUF928 domain-containing protein [Lyngbya aestuarii]ERT08536.1 hypothetical protein M595_1466 [Lyngbya aestuarii BL J]